MANIYIWPPAGTGGGAASDVNIFDSAGSSITLGQKAMAASLPVVIASNQSAIPVTSGGPTNYGVPDVNTPREASMVGVGAAAVSVTNPMPVELSNGVAFYNAPTTAQIPATLGQKTMAASLAVTVASDQSAIPVTVSNIPSTADTNYGTPTANTIRTASMLGMGNAAVSVANPVFVEPGNGTNSYSSAAIAASQFTVATATAVPESVGLSLGWDGTTHREISVSTTGVVNVSDANFPSTVDTNYGTPGASTIRTASMLGMGNAAVSVSNPVFVEPGNGTNSYSSAAIAASQFTVSTATAVPESVGLALGWDGTIHREIAVDTSGHPQVVTSQLPASLGQTTMAGSTSVAIASDQSAIPVTISGGALNYGVSTAAQRTAAQIGNATGAADFNYGAAGAQTVRTASMLGMGSTAVSVTNPVNVLPGNGTNNYDSTAIAAAQFTVSTATAIPEVAGFTLGWDGTTHREISVNTSGYVNTTATLSNTVTTPIFVEPGNGVNNYTSAAIAAAQFTQATATAVPLGAGLSMGWDGATHREISVTNTGAINTTATLANTVTTPIFVEAGNGVNNFDSTAVANAQFTVASATAVPEMVSFNVGWDGTTHREISVNTSGYVNTTATLANTVTTPIFVEPGNGVASYNSAAIAAAQFTQATAAAVPIDIGLALGWDGATHREISVDTSGHVNTNATLSNTVTTPLFVEPGNGVASYTSVAITAAQQTFSTAAAVPQNESVMMGWDGTVHREIAVTTTGAFTTSSAGLALQGSAYLDASSTNISTTYVQLIASTSGTTSWVSIFNGSGSMLQLGVGAMGSEVLYLIIPPGGIDAALAIPTGSRVAVKQTTIGSAMTSGYFSINCLG